jgi:hypothetical protein
MKGGIGYSMHSLVLTIQYAVLRTFLASSCLMILEYDSLQYSYEPAYDRTT